MPIIVPPGINRVAPIIQCLKKLLRIHDLFRCGAIFLPSCNFLSFFGQTFSLLTIVKEINWCALVVDEHGNTMGGLEWEDFFVFRLKALLAICLYMVMKRQPNMKSYWQKKG